MIDDYVIDIIVIMLLISDGLYLDRYDLINCYGVGIYYSDRGHGSLGLGRHRCSTFFSLGHLFKRLENT